MRTARELLAFKRQMYDPEVMKERKLNELVGLIKEHVRNSPESIHMDSITNPGRILDMLLEDPSLVPGLQRRGFKVDFQEKAKYIYNEPVKDQVQVGTWFFGLFPKYKTREIITYSVSADYFLEIDLSIDEPNENA